MTDLLRQQVREPEEQRQLRRSIPVLTPIEDAVSVAVRHQYEENPYPRWVKCEPPGRPWTIDQFLGSRFPAAPFRNLGKANVDILIAGCGTGQQEIETAQRFPQARLLAVDLSLSSLAHAERHTLALGLERIDYAQADILKLASVGRSFDVIVTSGVLHHLAEPFAGWKVLLSLLRPGGVMAIGLYSELARGHVRAARSFIAERGYQPTAEAIRRCRQELMGFARTAPHHGSCGPRISSAPASAAICSSTFRNTASRCRRSMPFYPLAASHSWGSTLANDSAQDTGRSFRTTRL